MCLCSWFCKAATHVVVALTFLAAVGVSMGIGGYLVKLYLWCGGGLCNVSASHIPALDNDFWEYNLEYSIYFTVTWVALLVALSVVYCIALSTCSYAAHLIMDSLWACLCPCIYARDSNAMGGMHVVQWENSPNVTTVMDSAAGKPQYVRVGRNWDDLYNLQDELEMQTIASREEAELAKDMEEEQSFEQDIV